MELNSIFLFQSRNNNDNEARHWLHIWTRNTRNLYQTHCSFVGSLLLFFFLLFCGIDWFWRGSQANRKEKRNTRRLLFDGRYTALHITHATRSTHYDTYENTKCDSRQHYNIVQIECKLAQIWRILALYVPIGSRELQPFICPCRSCALKRKYLNLLLSFILPSFRAISLFQSRASHRKSCAHWNIGIQMHVGLFANNNCWCCCWSCCFRFRFEFRVWVPYTSNVMQSSNYVYAVRWYHRNRHESYFLSFRILVAF